MATIVPGCTQARSPTRRRVGSEAMTEPGSLFASARRILESAARDTAGGLYMSACVGAQRAAVMATEAWLRGEGQPLVSASVYENVCMAPDADAEVRESARLLDRHRIDEGPHGSAAGVANSRREAEEAVLAGRRVLDFVERRMEASG